MKSIGYPSQGLDKDLKNMPGFMYLMKGEYIKG